MKRFILIVAAAMLLFASLPACAQTIAMEDAIEAMSCISADWCPTLRMINICAHE